MRVHTYVHLGGCLCYMYMHKSVCMTTMCVCVLCTCMPVGASMCMFTSTQCLCMGIVCRYMLPVGAMFVSWGSVCVLCNARVSVGTAPVVYTGDRGGQRVFLCVECLHICMWG